MAAETEGRPRPSAALRRVVEPVAILRENPSLSWLVSAFSAMTLAEWGYVTALAVEAFRLDGPVAVGLVGFRLFVGSVASFFNAGYLQRHPTGRVLTGIALTRTVILALSAALAANGSRLAPLLVLVGIDAIVSAPYRSAQSALLPILARTPRELAAAAMGISTAKTLSQALGAIAGGFLLVVAPPSAVFAGAAGVMLVGGLATRRFRTMPVLMSASGSAGGFRGLAHDSLAVVRHRYVGGLLLVSGLRTFVRGMWMALAVISSLRLLHAGSAGVGLLMLAAGVGALAAVPISGALIGRPQLDKPTVVAFVACGVPLVLIAGLPLLYVALFFVAAWGIGMAVADVATFSLLYRLLDTPLLPRVTAAIESAKLALEGLGALAAPLLASALGIRWALALAGLPLPIVILGGRKPLRRLDATAGERARLLSLLHGVAFLEPLDMAALEALASRVVRRSVPAGTDVVRQGDAGDCFYVVAGGTAEVLVDGFEVGSVAAGGYFGERALLRDVARMATVQAREPMDLLVLQREDFLNALTGSPEAVLPSTMSQARPFDAGEEPGPRERFQILSRVSLLSHLDAGALRQLATASRIERWPAGTNIIRRGEQGDRFFVMLAGRATVSGDSRALAQLRPGDQFGEISLLHDVPRQADVTAESPVVALSLPGDAFVAAVRARVISG